MSAEAAIFDGRGRLRVNLGMATIDIGPGQVPLERADTDL